MGKRTKWCPRCENDLPLSRFSVRKSGRRAGQPQSYCRECMSAYDKERYRNRDGKTKQRMKDKRRRILKRNRRFVFAYLQEHPCIDCGEEDPVVLDFDHQRDKHLTVSQLLGRGVSIERLSAEIKKCEVRCANCHRRRTASEGGWFKLNGV